MSLVEIKCHESGFGSLEEAQNYASSSYATICVTFAIMVMALNAFLLGAMFEIFDGFYLKHARGIICLVCYTAE